MNVFVSNREFNFCTKKGLVLPTYQVGEWAVDGFNTSAIIEKTVNGWKKIKECENPAKECKEHNEQLTNPSLVENR